MGRGRPHGAGKESGLLEQGPSLPRPHRAEAVAGRAVALRQPAIGRGGYRLGRRVRPGQYREGAKDPKMTVHTYAGSGAAVYAFNTKVAPFDDIRVRQALVMAIDRKKMSQAITNGLARPASNPYGDGSWVKCKDDGALPEDIAKAKELIKDYGKPVDFKMIISATPRGRTVGQVMQQLWKRVGANMEIEQVDQATIVPRAFQRQFQLTPWRIVDLADPDVQMYANFHTGSPVAL